MSNTPIRLPYTPPNILLVALSVLLVYLSSPAVNWAWLSWLWLVPVTLATVGHSPLRAGLTLGSCAWLFWAISIWWMVPALTRFSDVSNFLALTLFAIITLTCAMPYLITGVLLGKYDWIHQKAGLWQASAAFTVVLSWIPSLIPGSPLHAQYRHPEWIQHLDLGGLPFVIFFNVLFQMTLVQCIHETTKHKTIPVNKILIAVTIFCLVNTYGYTRLKQIRDTYETAPQLNIGLLQPNLTRDSSVDILVSDTRELAANNPDTQLFIWPEFPPPFSVIENPQDRQQANNLNKELKTPIMLTSGYVYNRSTDGKRLSGYFNAAHLIQQTAPPQHYYKQVLVPFFEYLPYANLLTQWFPGTLKYIPGKQPTLFTLDNNIRVIPAICYEVIFSSLIREFVKANGNIIINPVNDGWFGDSDGSEYHFSLALFRSIEYRIPYIRVANSGISAAVQSSGDIISNSETQLQTRDARTAQLALPGIFSLYNKWGDWFLYLITALFLIDLTIRLKSNLPLGFSRH